MLSLPPIYASIFCNAPTHASLKISLRDLMGGGTEQAKPHIPRVAYRQGTTVSIEIDADRIAVFTWSSAIALDRRFPTRLSDVKLRIKARASRELVRRLASRFHTPSSRDGLSELSVSSNLALSHPEQTHR